MKFLLLAVLGVVVTVASESEILRDFAVGNRQFTADVYKCVPYLSAETVLALVNIGAGGETAQQISSALHLPGDKEKVKQIFRELSPHLQSTEDYTLSSANRVYVKTGSTIKDRFKSTAADVFKAGVRNINFENKQQVASEMNRWVEEKTHSKIKNLIRPDDLNKDTRSVIINAMYFHGKWATQFQKEFIRKMPFYINNRYYVEVDMMQKTGRFKYLESPQLNAKFLELPYAGNDITMTFALPDDKEGLSALEARIITYLFHPTVVLRSTSGSPNSSLRLQLILTTS